MGDSSRDPTPHVCMTTMHHARERVREESERSEKECVCERER